MAGAVYQKVRLSRTYKTTEDTEAHREPKAKGMVPWLFLCDSVPLCGCKRYGAKFDTSLLTFFETAMRVLARARSASAFE